MSTDDPRESSTRVDRSRWTVALLLVPLALTLASWRGQDRAEELSQLRARGVLLGARGVAIGALPAIPLHVNESVEHWIEEFQTTRKGEFEALLERRGLFEGLITEKLRDRGMPEDLLYLAMIESGLSAVAVSQASAVGLWQFTSATALHLGLRVDEYVDERRDPVRATDAALDYLEWLRARFGSWYLAAAAYNAGPGRVERILHRHADGRTGDEDIYWEVMRYLPRETRDYVPRLIATTILANDADLLGFAGTDSDMEAYEFETLFVPGRTSLVTVAESLGVDPGVLLDLNPHLVRGVTPPGEIYGVRVPIGKIRTVMAYMALGPGAVRAD